MEAHVELFDLEEERLVCGSHDRHARAMRSLFGVAFVSRGGRLKIIGEEDAVRKVKRLVHRILERHRGGTVLAEADVARMIEDASMDASGAVMGGHEGEVPFLPPHVRPKSKGQERYIRAMAEHEICFGIGPAGTGKTYLAVAAAIAALKTGTYRRLVLARPAVEAGEKLGFLPGDYQAKVNPYLRPLYDAIESFLDPGRFKRYVEGDLIEIVPLAYMRGRTLDRAFIILDEAQNTTSSQMKMFLTRMGNGSKIVVTGDITQIDLPENVESGLVQVMGILKGIKGIGMVRLDERDIFRHPLVQAVVTAYERAEARSAKGRGGRKNGDGAKGGEHHAPGP